jgi:hypothetical protein
MGRSRRGDGRYPGPPAIPIPLDRRHRSKVDYAALKAMLR